MIGDFLEDLIYLRTSVILPPLSNLWNSQIDMELQTVGSVASKDARGDTNLGQSAHSAEIQAQIQGLSGRDWQLWGIGSLVILVLTVGFLTLVRPNLPAEASPMLVDNRYLPQLFLGLVSLVVLLNVYLVAQRRSLDHTRRRLVRELVFNERIEHFSLVDPLTQLLNRRGMEQITPREISRANRLGSNLIFVLLDLRDFKGLNARLGQTAGDQLLIHFARLLTSTFRGGDGLYRYGGDEFLVVMPDTTEAEVEPSISRLAKKVDLWNVSSNAPYEMAFDWVATPYVPALTLIDVLRRAEDNMLLKKHPPLAQPNKKVEMMPRPSGAGAAAGK